MDLNNPDIRQSLLRERLTDGRQLVAADLATEFGISIDTVRRDLIALADAGAAVRVRGGAVPVRTPARPLHERRADRLGPSDSLITAALRAVAGARTLVLDGGLTVLALARALSPVPGLLVITPSPWVATAVAERGIPCHLLGGQLSPQGGIAVGATVEADLTGVAAEIAVLGACGLEAGFGLSSDDLLESAIKRSMAQAAARVMVLTDASKLGQRARHRTLTPEEIDMIVTDAAPELTAAFSAQGTEVIHG